MEVREREKVVTNKGEIERVIKQMKERNKEDGGSKMGRIHHIGETEIEKRGKD